MNKMEYLSKLEACLKHRLSKAEINDIMRDYAEYFEEGRRQSKTDFEISAKTSSSLFESSSSFFLSLEAKIFVFS